MKDFITCPRRAVGSLCKSVPKHSAAVCLDRKQPELRHRKQTPQFPYLWFSLGSVQCPCGVYLSYWKLCRRTKCSPAQSLQWASFQTVTISQPAASKEPVSAAASQFRARGAQIQIDVQLLHANPTKTSAKGKVDERMECTVMDIYQNRLPQCDQIILILFLIFTVGEVACGPSPEAIPVHNVVPSARTIALLIRKPCARSALTSLPGMEKKNHAKIHPPCFPARIRVIYKIHRSI